MSTAIAELARAVASTWSRTWRISRGAMVASLVLTLAISLSGPLLAVAIGQVIGQRIGQGEIFAALVMCAGLQALASAAAMTTGLVRRTLTERVGFALELRLHQLLARLGNVAPYDDPEFVENTTLLMAQRGSLGSAADAGIVILGACTQLVVSALLLAKASPYFALIVGLIAPLWVVTVVNLSRFESAIVATARHTRAGNRLYGLTASPGAARELRTLGLRHHLPHMYRAEMHTALHGIERTERRNLGRSLCVAAADLGCVGAVIYSVVHQAERGQLTASVAVVTILLGMKVSGQLTTLATALPRLISTRYDLARLDRIEELLAQSTETTKTSTTETNSDSRQISLHNVTYRYTALNDPAIDRLDLDIQPGETIAVVGKNGAGKTTLSSLILGLREPTEGVCQTSLPSNTAAAFQLAPRFELPLREVVALSVVALSDPRGIDDDAAILDTLQLVGLHPNEIACHDPLDALLSPRFGGQVDLSGGQWQKLALARALFRANARLYVFDEPTASLDPKSEEELFTRWLAARPANSAALIVTHRLGILRRVDRIIVLECGRIVEEGTLAELGRQQTRLAKLLKLHSRLLERRPGSRVDAFNVSGP